MPSAKGSVRYTGKGHTLLKLPVSGQVKLPAVREEEDKVYAGTYKPSNQYPPSASSPWPAARNSTCNTHSNASVAWHLDGWFNRSYSSTEFIISR
jgi:hypothetical protein